VTYRALITILPLLFSLTSFGSDHIDLVGGPQQKEVFPHAELTDLYSWVSEDGKLLLGLNAFSHPANTNPAPAFDGSVEYQFELRKVKLKEPTQILVTPAQGDVAATTRDSRIRVPVIKNGYSAAVVCRPEASEPNCVVSIDNMGGTTTRLPNKTFAGRRAESFCLDIVWGSIRMKGVIDPNVPAAKPYPIPDAVRIPIAEAAGFPPTRNLCNVLNVLNISLELNVEEIFGENTQLIAVAAEAYTFDNAGVRQRRDRLGRPEITNMTIGLQEVSENYNKASTFNLTKEQIENYEALIRYGILGWDRQDGKNDWKHGGELHDILETLVVDALIIDTTKKCQFSEDSFLAVERGMGEHQSCGGRVPKEDIIDTLFSFYTVGVDAKNDTYGDGAGALVRQPQDAWPFFAAP
jgi:hypothetical protein